MDRGRIFITWPRAVRMGPGMRVDATPFRLTGGPTALGGEWLARPTVKLYEDKSTGGAVVMVYRVEVPMWGIVGVYVVMCGGVVVWRRRAVSRADERTLSRKAAG